QRCKLGHAGGFGPLLRKLKQRKIAQDHHVLSIPKRIVRNRLPDILTRCRIKQRVVPVQNPVDPPTITNYGQRILRDLAVHERPIVAPGSVKQLVAFYTNRETLGDVLVVDQAVAEIENARTTGPRDDLLKWIERVECARTHPNFRRGRSAKRRNTTGERMI